MMLLQAVDVMPVTTELPSLITTSAMTVAIIQWFKNTRLIPFMDEHTAAINRTVAWIAAFASAAGIHYTWDATTATIAISGLHPIVVLHAAGDVLKSYAFQWLVYKGVVKPQVATAQVAATLANVAPQAPVVTPVVVAPRTD